MKVVVRCDRTPGAGIGHMVRCAALAHALRERGHSVDLGADDEPIAAPAGFIVIDSYRVDAEFIARAAAGAPVCVIDDLADRDLGAATVIVNQNFGANAAQYAAVQASLLLGPRFAILRPQFAASRAALRREFSESDSRLLVTLGGGEVQRSLHAVLEALEAVPKTLDITVLGLDGAAQRSHHRIHCERYVEDVAGAMTLADVCLTAGGTSTLELCCLGSPMLVVTIADNQVPGSIALAATGAGVVAGTLDESLPQLADEVGALFADPARRRRLSEAALNAVDGLGAARIAEQLEIIAGSWHSRS